MRNLLFAALLTACQTPSSQQNALDAQSCENQLAEAQETLKEAGFVDTTVRGVKTVGSYTLAAVGFTTDAVVVTVGAAGVFVIACGPLIAAQAAASHGGNVHVQCFWPFDGDPLEYESIGKSAYKNTADWRKDHGTEFSERMRRVAYCFENRGDTDSLTAAHLQLTGLKDGLLFSEVDAREKSTVREDLRRIEQKLAAKDSGYAQKIEAKKQENAAALTMESAKIAAALNSQKAAQFEWPQPRQGSKWRFQMIPVTHREVGATVCQTFGPDYGLPTAGQATAAAKEGVFADGNVNKTGRAGALRVWLAEADKIFDLRAKKVRDYRGEKDLFLLCTN